MQVCSWLACPDTGSAGSAQARGEEAGAGPLMSRAQRRVAQGTGGGGGGSSAAFSRQAGARNVEQKDGRDMGTRDGHAVDRTRSPLLSSPLSPRGRGCGLGGHHSGPWRWAATLRLGPQS